MIVGITGGTGFIGRHLIGRHVALGDEVRVLSRRSGRDIGLDPRVLVFNGDLVEKPNLAQFLLGVDVLYHCAAEILDESKMERLHLDGTRALVAAANGRIGRWVQLSSTGAYGSRRLGVVTEDSQEHPFGVYETTKAGADAIVSLAGEAGAFSHVVLRPSNVYGADMQNQSLFSLVSMVKKGLFFFIGPAGASANYIHVENVVEALLLCARRPDAAGKTYNVSDHSSMEHFIGMICRHLGKRAPPRLRVPERFARTLVKLVPGLPLSSSRIDALTSRVVYSTARIEGGLGYRHLVTMEEGLRDLVEGWKAIRAKSL